MVTKADRDRAAEEKRQDADTGNKGYDGWKDRQE